MRFLTILSVIALIASSAYAQEASIDALPPRYQALAKNDRVRLVRVLGTAEMQATFAPTSAYSGDGKVAVYVEDLSTGTDEKPNLLARLHVWNTVQKSWPREVELVGKAINGIALSTDGRVAAMAGVANVETEKTPQSFLALIDLDSGKPRHFVLTKAAPALSILLDADGDSVWINTTEAVQRWNLKQGKQTAEIKAEQNRQVLFLPNGPKAGEFVTILAGGEVQFVNALTAKPIRRISVKDTNNPSHVALSRDGVRLAWGDFDGAVRIVDVATGKEIVSVRPDKTDGERFLSALAFSDDAKSVVACWVKREPAPDDIAVAKLFAWDIAGNKLNWARNVPYRGRLPIRVHGDQMTIGGGPNLFDVRQIADGKRVASWGAHKHPINVLGFSAAGDLLSSCQSGSLLIWKKGGMPIVAGAHEGPITAMAMAPDRTHWLSGGADGSIQHGTVDGKPAVAWKARHAMGVNSLAFSRAGEFASSGSSDRTVKIWLPKTSQEIATFAGHAESVNAVAFAPDDRWLASGSHDATIRIWPIKAGKADEERDVIILDQHKKPVTCLAFASDGKTLVSAGQDNALIVWDWRNGKRIRTITGHKNWITSLLLFDDRTAITTSDDLSLCWWDLETGKEIGQVDFGAIGDCPRCITRGMDGRIFVGTSSWLIYELELRRPQSKRTSSSSNG